jgi:putative hydrolase of the HAD superfamily
MIKHIFFDLDHTIWDFDKNAQETLNELYIQHELDGLGCGTVEEFIISDSIIWETSLKKH